MTYFWIISAFATGFLVVFGVNLFLADLNEASRKKFRQRLDEEFRERIRRDIHSSQEEKLRMYEEVAEGFGGTSDAPSRRAKFATMVEQSGVSIGPGQLLALSAAIGFAPGLLLGLFSRSILMGAAVGLLASSIPVVYIRFARRRRMEKLQSQLPDAFEVMSRTIRAGQTMSQALQAVADEFALPVSAEFGYCYEQQNLGMTPEAAMHDLVRRTGLMEIKIFVLAVTVHRQTGGNLNELLEKLATVIRERQRIRGVVQTLTAEGRFQAMILLGLPPFLLAAMFVLNPGYASVLLDLPALLVGVGISMTIGAIWMRSIISYDF